MDKVRFTIGDTHVWQGFHDGDHGMVGALVWVTADTLRHLTDHFQSNWSTDFDRVHNAPTEDWATLAFGDSGTIKSPVDGITPLYRLTSAEALIVQRFDPEGGKTHERHFGEGNIELVPNGAWVNESAIDEDALTDEVPEIVTHGFIIDPQDVAEGRSDAPLIDTLAARATREAKAERAEQHLNQERWATSEDYRAGWQDGLMSGRGSDETADDEQPEQNGTKKVWVESVSVHLSDGTSFVIQQDTHPHNNGTSFSGNLIPAGHELEDAINVAINELDLYPEADPAEV